jgi:hypothetical protein
MSARKIWAALVLTGLLGCTGLWADADGAKAAYMRGIQKEKAKDYSGAVVDYSAAVVDYPNYYWAYKELGNCFYYLGDKAKAVENYDKYLTYAPGDIAIKTFADKIRPAGDFVVEQPSDSALPTTTPEPPLKHWALKLDAGFNSYSMTDWNTYWSTYGLTPPSAAGLSVGGGAGYYFTPNLCTGLDLNYLTFTEVVTATGAGSATFSFPVLFIGPKFIYTFPKIVSKADLDLGLDLGYLTLMGANATSTFGTGSATYTGGGFGGDIIAGESYYLTPGFSIDGTLGYRIGSIATVTGSNSSTGKSFTLTKTDGTTPMSMDYSGFYAKLGLGFRL